MNTASPTVRTVEAADPLNDRCDADSGEKAIVAALVGLGGEKTARLTFCGHHWDKRSPQLRAIVIASHDLRDFGWFADERPK